jgi:hypothetical protein
MLMIKADKETTIRVIGNSGWEIWIGNHKR